MICKTPHLSCTVLLLLLSNVACAQECVSHGSCSDCVGADCTWVIGECHDGCIVADVSCYNTESFVGMTSAEICKVEENDNLDSALCSQKSSCSDCTQTNLVSNASRKCMWFPPSLAGGDGFCSHECLMIGCGEKTCDVQESEIDPTVIEIEFIDCATHVTCGDCVGHGCSWTTGWCYEDCIIADAACYSRRYFVGKTAEEVCQVEQNNKLDFELCSNSANCDDCTKRKLVSDPSNTCMWFTPLDDGDVGFCGHECGMWGCGVDKCNASEHDLPESETEPTVIEVELIDCATHVTCGDCVGHGCSWTTGRCYEDCIIADAACYSRRYFVGKTAEEVCQVEKNNKMDFELCSNSASCEDCTKTKLVSDPSNTCMWFTPLDDGDVGFCGHECGMWGCGVDQCNASEKEQEHGADGMSSEMKSDEDDSREKEGAQAKGASSGNRFHGTTYPLSVAFVVLALSSFMQ